MKYRFILYGDRCCACASCQIGCIDQNAPDSDAEACGFRQIISLETVSEDGTVDYCYGSVSCLHCEDAACISACPKKCIARDPDTGFVVCDNSACIRCKRCHRVCPYHIPQFRPSDGKMVKCDGCNERVKNGLAPACVRACPFGALECVPEEAYERDRDALPVLLQRLQHNEKNS